MNKHLFRFGLVAATLAAQAQSQPPSPPSGGKPPGPPPEAVAACQGKAVGTKVSFKMWDGNELKGVCKMIDGQLAAAPPDGTPPPASR